MKLENMGLKKQNTRPSLKERAQYLADNLNQNLAKKYPQQTPKQQNLTVKQIKLLPIKVKLVGALREVQKINKTLVSTKILPVPAVKINKKQLSSNERVQRNLKAMNDYLRRKLSLKEESQRDLKAMNDYLSNKIPK